MDVLGVDNVLFDVGDLELAVAHYRRLGLVLRFVVPGPRIALFAVGGERPGLVLRERPGAAAPGGARLWVEVPDALAARAELAALGVACGAPFDTATGTTVEIADTWGNVLGLADYRVKPELARPLPRPAPTARLEFRSWTAADEPLAVALWGDPRVMALIDARAADPGTARARLEREIAGERQHGVCYWPIFRRDGGQFVGCCGLRPHGAGELELGFHLLPACWGQGFATEAASSAIAHAFAVRGAVRLVAGHHPDNATSRRTLEKLGFRYQRHQLYEPTGREHPYYSLEPPRATLPAADLDRK